MLEPGVLALLLFLGTWAALDGTSVAQVMISRPLISGSLAGIVLGVPEAGLLVGAVLEVAHLAQLPVGAARIAEPGPAAVPAAVAAALAPGAPGLALGVGIGVGWSLLGGGTMIAQRRLNGRLFEGLEEGRLAPGDVVRRHWAAVAMDAVRGFVLVGSGVIAAVGLSGSVAGSWPLDDPTTLALLLLPGALAVGTLLRTWSLAPTRWLLLAIGVLAGVALSGLV